MKEKVNEILELCFKINGFEQRQREKTGDKPTIFIEFSGHVMLLTLRIHEKGWQEGEYADLRINIWLCDTSEKNTKYIEECVSYLKALEGRCNNEYLQEAV